MDAALSKFSDQEWRLDNLYWIVSDQGVEMPFVRNNAQVALWRRRWFWNLILKARQRGISTFIAILMLDTCLFNRATHCGVIDATLVDATKKLDKIRFAYSKLPAALQNAVPLASDNATSLEWTNGSRVDVGTSHRGGTLQFLHVSEMGKIAATAPKRSKEIRTGAFGTVHKGSLVFVESTAEGAAGDFFELVQEADAALRMGKVLSPQEFKLTFLPWYEHDAYREDPAHVVIPKELSEYFDQLEAEHRVKLDDHQHAWYAITRKKIGADDMWREFPSFAEEAFKISVEGAYFRTQMTKAREEGRIGKVPVDPSRPVNTFWDIGKSDNTSIWFHQSHGTMHHLVDYYENSGEGVEHYARVLADLRDKRGWTYGRHFGPHDLDNSHWLLPGAQATVDVARRLGINFVVIPRIRNKSDAIEAARNCLSMCWIDEEHCSQGIRCLDNYRKAWDDKNGTYKSEPLHNWASHGADALMTGACGFTPEYVPPPEDRYRRRPARTSAWAA